MIRLNEQQQSNQRFHGIVRFDVISKAALHIRKLFRKYGVKIPANSILEECLSESEKFSTATRDVLAPTTGAARDDLAIQLGHKQLITYRLAESLRSLIRRRTPKIKERLAELATKTAGQSHHKEQFLDAEYEIFCAAEITIVSSRVSFIRTKQKSRYTKRVEFLIKHTYPAECKRPRHRNTVLRNVKAAARKIIERPSPGLLFIALDDLFLQGGHYCEAESVEQVAFLLSKQFDDFWQHHGANLCAAIRGTPVRAIVFTCTRLAYYHESGAVALPTFRLAVTPEGAMIAEEVIPKCVALLGT